MAKRAPLILAGWRGLELDEERQTERHDRVALNVDYGYGDKRARLGCSVTHTGAPSLARLHLHRQPNGDLYVLSVGPSAIGGAIAPALKFRAYDAWGNALGASNQDLNSAFGEPKTDRPRLTLLSAILSVSRESRFVTLIVTDNTAYVFDPIASTSTVRLLSTSTDALKSYSDGYTYWSTVPHGAIACEHQSRVYYAGFKAGDSATLDGAVPSGQQTAKKLLEKVLDSARTRVGLAPYMVAYSDEYDPASIRNVALFATEDMDTVTGLASFQNLLWIFTSAGVWAMSGSRDEDFTFQKVSVYPCVAPGSVVEAEGRLYYLGPAGVYVVAGDGSSALVSEPVSALFTGGTAPSFLGAAVDATLTTLGWPFAVDPADLPHSNGFYHPVKRQLWWSLPVKSRTAGSFAVTLVYDLAHEAWSLWTQNPGQSNLATVMYDAVHVHGRGVDHVLTSGATSYLQRYGGSYRDGPSGSELGVPLIWQTGRILRDERDTAMFHNLWLKMLATHKTPSSNAPTVYVTGEESFHDSTQEQAITGSTSSNFPMHPGEDSALYFLGAFVLGTHALSATDWWTCPVETRVQSQSLRVGLLDNPASDDRGNLAIVRSIAVGLDGGRTP